MHMIILWTVLSCYKSWRISVKHTNRRGKQKYGFNSRLGYQFCTNTLFIRYGNCSWTISHEYWDASDCHPATYQTIGVSSFVAERIKTNFGPKYFLHVVVYLNLPALLPESTLMAKHILVTTRTNITMMAATKKKHLRQWELAIHF